MELSILSKHFAREIAAYDIQTQRCDVYGSGEAGVVFMTSSSPTVILLLRGGLLIKSTRPMLNLLLLLRAFV